MMLLQTSIDAHLSSIPDHGNQEIMHVWIPNDDHKNKDDSSCSRNFLTSSQTSTEVTMSETSKPNLVYKRRKTHTNNQISKPTLVYKRKKIQTLCCSSSKSNMELNSCSLNHQTNDVGECSSSIEMKDSSETNSCFSFLEHHLVVESLNHLNGSCVDKVKDFEKGICDLKACKVCDKSTLTLKMLTCDLCEEWFHMSCCSPVVKKVPKGDWFCHSCLRKKVKKMKEMTSFGKLSKGYSGPIVAMLRDVDSYESDVSIGEDFQAEVPDWSGPLTDQLNDYIEPMEMSPSECACYQKDCDSSKKLIRLSPIGNWLQCQEVIDKVNGTVCGKWRRAPLFEVQSDDWECFSSVLWDPTHADCAVPQELDTDQVLKQLKYIEMLRPRLSVKRWKLGVQKGEEHRNTQKL